MVRRRFALLLLLAISTTGSLASVLSVGPEREVAPGTTWPSGGHMAAIGAGDDGFLAVWNSTWVPRTLMRRYDGSARAIDATGVMLPVKFVTSTVGWNGSEYVVIGQTSTAAGIWAVRMRPDGAVVDEQPKRIVNTASPRGIRLTNGASTLLVTWEWQTSFTQTVSAILLSRDLEVLKPEFVIATRDVSGVGPLDRDTSASVASDGRNYLVARENIRSPETLQLHTVAADGAVASLAPVASPRVLQPRVVTDRAGFVALWHDQSSIRAMRIARDGSPQGDARELVSSEAIAEFSVASTGAELALVWGEPSEVLCTGRTFVPNRTIRAQRFDPDLHPIDGAQLLDDPSHTNALATYAAAATPFETMIAWTSTPCGGSGDVRAAAMNAGRIETVTLTIAPSAQRSPAAATDGTNVLAVWSEWRGTDRTTRVYGTLLDANGEALKPSFALSPGDYGEGSARVAYGAGRYFVLWWESRGAFGQFVTREGQPEGEPFRVAETPRPADVVWDGAAFTVVWADAFVLRSARIFLGPFVQPGPARDEGAALVLGEIVAGAGGEVAAVYRAETTSRHEIRFATLRSRWSEPEMLTGTSRPCRSLHCPKYFPMSVGWTGTRYVAAWIRSDHPGTGAWVETSVPFGNVNQTLSGPYASNEHSDQSMQMRWSGTQFFAVYRMKGFSAYLTQLNAGVLDASGRRVGEAAAPTAIAEAESDSPPALVIVSPDRAIVLYTRLSGLTQRLFARRMSTVPVPPRRRAAGGW